jgi:hypothetical protein
MTYFQTNISVRFDPLTVRKKPVKKKDKLTNAMQFMKATKLMKQYELYHKAKRLVNIENNDVPVIGEALRVLNITTLDVRKRVSLATTPYTNFKSYDSKVFISDFGFAMTCIRSIYHGSDMKASLIDETDKLTNNQLDLIIGKYINMLKATPRQVLNTQEHIFTLNRQYDVNGIRYGHSMVMVINIGKGIGLIYDPNYHELQQNNKSYTAMSCSYVNLCKLYLQRVLLFVYRNLYDKPNVSDDILLKFLKHEKGINTLQSHVISGGQGAKPFCLLHSAKFIDTYVNSKRSVLNHRNKGVYFEPCNDIQYFGNRNSFFTNDNVKNEFKKKITETSSLKLNWLKTTMCELYKPKLIKKTEIVFDIKSVTNDRYLNFFI